MTTFMQKLNKRWVDAKSYVCVGLDPEPERFPNILQSNPHPIFAFNKIIIDATADLVCAYKPQIAHYSARSAENELEMTMQYIHENHPNVPVILDSKRGDIGSTAQYYAKEAFERYKSDAVTVNPYLGYDTLLPFLEYKEKGTIILCRTSNAGSADVQTLPIGQDGSPLYMHIAKMAATKWNSNNNICLVVGATQPEALAKVREAVGNLPLLIPGIGAQGGDIAATVSAAQTLDGSGMIINSSRAILYHAADLSLIEYSKKVRESTLALRDQINQYCIAQTE